MMISTPKDVDPFGAVHTEFDGSSFQRVRTGLNLVWVTDPGERR